MKLFWTDAHINPHTNHLKDLTVWLEHAKQVIDFMPIAYYPYFMRDFNGFGMEDILDMDVVQKDFSFVQEFVRNSNRDYEFPVFLGYEWQGAGKDGDHNVFYLDDDQPLIHCMRYKELCDKLPKGRAIAIPHHLAYQVGSRGKNWATHNSEYSPFAEIFSSHGSSESDITHLPMMRHIHMGPRTSGTGVSDGLKQGIKMGIIASGDNHSVPAMFGHGFMAVWAEELTRESLWEAMLSRRVYGVTGDKISLCYKANNEYMGSTIAIDKDVRHEIVVRGSNFVDRVELLLDEKVVKSFNHQKEWDANIHTGKITFKFRLELGWGPDTRVFHDITTRVWKGELRTSGKIIGIEKCFTAMGQYVNHDDSSAEFTLTTNKTTQTGKWMGVSSIENQSLIFEITDDIDGVLEINIDNKSYDIQIRELLMGGKLHALEDEVKELIKSRYGITEHYRDDPFWHNAYKVKLHQAVPEKCYNVELEHITSKYEKGCYRIRVHQLNGHMAWSSPIWIE